MLNSKLSSIILVVTLLLSACGPAQIIPPADQPQVLPSPTASWQLTFTQSGGLAGVNLGLQIASDGQLTAQDNRSGKSVTGQLDAATLRKLSGLVSSVALAGSQSPGSSCADCFLYDVQITSAGRTTHIQADDTTLGSSGAQELIALLQQLRDNALKSQP